MGSEKAKKGRARFMNPFLYDSSFLWPWIILSSSRHTRPTTAAVVVAMAGMILPAMSLLCMRKGGNKYSQICCGHHTPCLNARAATTHLVSICWRNVIILCSQIGRCYYEVHVEICIIVLNIKQKALLKKKNPACTLKTFQHTGTRVLYLFKVYWIEFELGCCLWRRQKGFQLLKPGVIYKTSLCYKKTINIG